MINGIIYRRGEELILISFYTEKRIPFDNKSQKKLDDIRKRFSKANLLLCNYRETRSSTEIKPIHFVQLNALNNKKFDIARLSVDEIVTLAYRGAILLTKKPTAVNNDKIFEEIKQDTPSLIAESGLDMLED